MRNTLLAARVALGLAILRATIAESANAKRFTADQYSRPESEKVPIGSKRLTFWQFWRYVFTGRRDKNDPPPTQEEREEEWRGMQW